MTTTTQRPAPPTALPTMAPVLRRGRSFLDREVLPGDENESRLTVLLATAAERGLDGVVIFGAAHLPEDLVYYANYTPTTFHGALVARAGEPPVLFAGKGGARDHPYIRTVSWVADIRYADALGDAVVGVADEWPGSWQRLGVAGLDTTLPHLVRDEVVGALGERFLRIDDLVATQRRDKSAREIAVLTTANRIAQAAARAAVDASAGGAGRRSALAAADFTARAGDAHDCRITVGAAGGVVSLSEVGDDHGPLTAVVAVEYLGYWGIAPIRLGDASVRDDDLVLDHLVARLAPGVDARDVVDKHGATVLVNGIGCAAAEQPGWAQQPGAVLRRHDVLTLVRVASDTGAVVLDARTVVIENEGAREL